MGYILKKTSLPEQWPEPEEKFKKMKIRGSGTAAETEYLAWGWLNAWDELNAWNREDNKRKCNLSINELLRWSSKETTGHSEQAKQCIENLSYDLKTTDQGRLIALLEDEIRLRWKEEPDGLFAKLKKLFANAKKDEIRILCHTHILSPDDLFIFKRCAEQDLTKKTFEGFRIISHIVSICILTQNFLNQQNTLKHYATLQESNVNDARLMEQWNVLKNICLKIETEMTTLQGQLKKQYEA